MLPGLFELTDEDKNSPGMRLSVWAEELTVADQAWDFMGSKPKNTLVVCLNVDDVRGIAPPEGFSGNFSKTPGTGILRVVPRAT